MKSTWHEWECPECSQNHVIADGANWTVPVSCSCGKRFKSLNALRSHGFVFENRDQTVEEPQ